MYNRNAFIAERGTLKMKKVIMETEKGTLTIELFDKEAPGTVKNFTDLIRFKI